MSKTSTVKQIRALIREELSSVLLEYEQIVVRRGNKLFVRDDEGNESILGSAVNFPEYSHLADGQTAEYTRGSTGMRSTLSSRRRRY